MNNWSNLVGQKSKQHLVLQSHQTTERSATENGNTPKKKKKPKKKNAQHWPAINRKKSNANPNPNTNTNTNTNNNNNIHQTTVKNGKKSFANMTGKCKTFATPMKSKFDTSAVQSNIMVTQQRRQYDNTHNRKNHNKNTFQKSVKLKNGRNTDMLDRIAFSNLCTQESMRKSMHFKTQTLSQLRRKWWRSTNFSMIHFPFDLCGIKMRGIQNRNLDCFINAIIQCLLSLPMLVSFLCQLSKMEAQSIGVFTFALYQTFALFRIQCPPFNAQNVPCNPISHPTEMIAILDEFRFFTGRQHFVGQQDSHEFLMYYIDKMHEEMVWSDAKQNRMTRKQRQRQNKSQSRKGNENNNGNANINNGDCNHNNNNNNPHNTENNNSNKGWSLVSRNIHHKTRIAHKVLLKESFVSILFAGEYYQMIKLENKRLRPTVGYQPFFSISVDIYAPQIGNLAKALELTLKKQTVTGIIRGKAGDWGDSNDGIKILHLSEVPFYLILHLKRFVFEDGQCFKVQKYIQYSTKLVIGSNLLFDKSQLLDKQSHSNTNANTNVNPNKKHHNHQNKNHGNKSQSTMASESRKKYKFFLRSVIVHTGDFVNRGHYISFCRRDYIQPTQAQRNILNNNKNKNKNTHNQKNSTPTPKQPKRKHVWLECNDVKMRQCTENEVMSQQAYVLIYQRCGAR